MREMNPSLVRVCHYTKLRSACQAWPSKNSRFLPPIGIEVGFLAIEVVPLLGLIVGH